MPTTPSGSRLIQAEPGQKAQERAKEKADKAAAAAGGEAAE